ncbi:MAG: hypothetical protein JSV82_07880 [Planctomycetota bacterium]|nr:MAG: hypothetical protein JSV82_07880 [Planctomycetota bacterium]
MSQEVKNCKIFSWPRPYMLFVDFLLFSFTSIRRPAIIFVVAFYVTKPLLLPHLFLHYGRGFIIIEQA